MTWGVLTAGARQRLHRLIGSAFPPAAVATPGDVDRVLDTLVRLSPGVRAPVT